MQSCRQRTGAPEEDAGRRLFCWAMQSRLFAYCLEREGRRRARNTPRSGEHSPATSWSRSDAVSRGEERSSAPRHTSVADRLICDDVGLTHNANTYSTTALRCSRSSGVLTSLVLAAGLGPETIAIYCLPLTSNVIGGAEKPEPTLIFHNWSSVVSSNAATVPSSSARNTSPPPVESVPLKFG
jgi:hypothetical protein